MVDKKRKGKSVQRKSKRGRTQSRDKSTVKPPPPPTTNTSYQSETVWDLLKPIIVIFVTLFLSNLNYLVESDPTRGPNDIGGNKSSVGVN
jgi:hypothetical protein